LRPLQPYRILTAALRGRQHNVDRLKISYKDIEMKKPRKADLFQPKLSGPARGPKSFRRGRHQEEVCRLWFLKRCPFSPREYRMKGLGPTGTRDSSTCVRRHLGDLVMEVGSRAHATAAISVAGLCRARGASSPKRLLSNFALQPPSGAVGAFARVVA
jgi:hypothetical protein